ncbi:hypothetical protein P8625_06170 [Tenacibaculum tangerinum]|uniref:Magnesium citrate secondary transporter n=1 Tax=Tenacibaculum tangerinum TaxID=3038772 RepID=A0ABY8L5Q1_9FLAO|nr:hypothetical protein [Tenacibaculum tangerinum]WGH76737.1 hypothetical protein P8625_06170 [Tenacibaculum tangerinum]
MQQKALPYYFIISVTVGTLIYSAQKLGVKLPSVVNNYVNDFLIIPIVLTICLFILQWSRGDKSYQISLGVILYICVVYSIVFELILPNYYSRYTADVIDVMLYFAGGFVFFVLQKIGANRQEKLVKTPE